MQESRREGPNVRRPPRAGKKSGVHIVPTLASAFTTLIWRGTTGLILRQLLIIMLGAYLFANGGHMVSLRWLALFRDFNQARDVNWGHTCLAHLYSVMDTLSRGTLR